MDEDISRLKKKNTKLNSCTLFKFQWCLFTRKFSFIFKIYPILIGIVQLDILKLFKNTFLKRFYSRDRLHELYPLFFYETILTLAPLAA